MVDKRQENTAPGLRSQVTVDRDHVAAGETLVVNLSVTNEREVAQFVQFTSGCLYGFGIWHEDGELVAPPPLMCTMNAPVVEYGPGEIVAREFKWTWDGRSPAPGVYSLKAGLGPRGERDSSAAVEIRLGVQ